jgi:hypothetical protein
MLTRRGSETGAREQDAAAKATEVAARVGNTVLEQSFLSGLDDLFEALKNPEQSAANFAGRFAQSMTPFAGLQRSKRTFLASRPRCLRVSTDSVRQ